MCQFSVNCFFWLASVESKATYTNCSHHSTFVEDTQRRRRLNICVGVGRVPFPISCSDSMCRRHLCTLFLFLDTRSTPNRWLCASFLRLSNAIDIVCQQLFPKAYTMTYTSTTTNRCGTWMANSEELLFGQAVSTSCRERNNWNCVNWFMSSLLMLNFISFLFAVCSQFDSFCVSLFADVLSFQPEFAEPIVNISVAVGRDATFTCHVRHLGGYRVSRYYWCNQMEIIATCWLQSENEIRQFENWIARNDERERRTGNKTIVTRNVSAYEDQFGTSFTKLYTPNALGHNELVHRRMSNSTQTLCRSIQYFHFNLFHCICVKR